MRVLNFARINFASVFFNSRKSRRLSRAKISTNNLVENRALIILPVQLCSPQVARAAV